MNNLDIRYTVRISTQYPFWTTADRAAVPGQIREIFAAMLKDGTLPVDQFTIEIVAEETE